MTHAYNLTAGLLPALLCLFVSTSVSAQQVASPAIASGSEPPAGCGLICEPKAKLTLTITGIDSLGAFSTQEMVANTLLLVEYTIDNLSVATLQGNVTVLINGQSVPPLLSQQLPLTSVPSHQQVTGYSALPAGAPAGFANVTVSFRSSFTCEAPHGGSRKTLPNCSGFQLYASATESVAIAADSDGDGLSDNYEQKILSTYAPLMLFSRDHGSEEQYRPIDVVDYLKGSKLVSKEKDIPSISNANLKPAVGQVLGPDRTMPNGDCATSNDVCSGKIPSDRELPINVFVSPSSTVQKGSPWQTVFSSRSVGLYGHVVPMLLSAISNVSLSPELTGYMTKNYPRTPFILKVEYWQFFGYSHDYQVPIPLPGELGHPDDHDADWCSVQLYINPGEPSPDKAILVSFHYAHGIQIAFDFTQSDSIKMSPVAYRAESTQFVPNPVYQLLQFTGENSAYAVDFPLEPKYDDLDDPCDKAKNDENICHAQDNTVQLARTDSSSPYVHPVVYVEWGGHEFWPVKDWKYFGASKHGGDGYSYWAAAPPNVGEVAASMDGLAGLLVTKFAGWWGYYGGIDNINPPPQGPTLHREWTRWLLDPAFTLKTPAPF